MSRFVTAEEWMGKVTAILIVITSFTFFAPAALDQSSEHAYFKRFKVVYREKLKQERRRLVADILKKRIETDDTSGYAANLPSFYNDLKTIQAEVADIAGEAGKDASSISDEYWNYYGTDLVRKGEEVGSEGNGDGSDENLERIWEDESIHWNTKSQRQESPANASEFEATNVSSSPKNFVEATVGDAKEVAILADESIEALKAVCMKVAGGYIPGGDTLLSKYIEELVNAAAEHVFKISRVSDLTRYFFNTSRPRGKIDFFSRIGNFWQKNKAQKDAVLRAESEAKKQEQLAVLQQQEAEQAKVREQEALLREQEQAREREREAIARQKEIESYGTEQLKYLAESRLENLIIQQVDEILIQNGGLGLNSNKFKAQLIKDYKKQIGFENLSKNEISTIASSPILNKNIFRKALRVGASMQLHPGPEATCPICNYMKAQAGY